jgi:hypothetical protein
MGVLRSGKGKSFTHQNVGYNVEVIKTRVKFSFTGINYTRVKFSFGYYYFSIKCTSNKNQG